jgi:hypothetical protein
MVESSLAVVGANLPLLRPLLHQKTYTDSYAWSLLRSFGARRSQNNSRTRVGSDDGSERVGSDGGSSIKKNDVHLAEKPKASHEVV